MQYNNNLNTNLTYLNAGEAGALADINRRETDAQNAFGTGLAGANAQIEANYIQNLINERDKEAQRQLQERQLQEQIRQFNENLALQKAQLYSRYNNSNSTSTSNRTSTSTSTKASSSPSTTTRNTSGTTTRNTSGTTTRSTAGTKADSSVVAQLNKLAKTNNFDIGEIRTSQGGLANVKLYTVNGIPYYKVGNDWIAYR